MPSAAPLYFPEFHRWSEISFLSKVILVLGKVEVPGHQIWAVVGLSHLGDLLFCQKLCTRCDARAGALCDEAANHQLPLAVVF